MQRDSKKPWQVRGASTLHRNPYVSVLQQDIFVSRENQFDCDRIWFLRAPDESLEYAAANAIVGNSSLSPLLFSPLEDARL